MTPTISATPRFIVRRNRPSRTAGLRNGRAHDGQVSADGDTAWPQSGHGTSEFADMGPRHGFGPALQASVPAGTGHALIASILPPIAGVTGPDPVGSEPAPELARLSPFSDQRSQRCAFAILRKRFAPILHSHNDFPAIDSSGRLAGALHGQPSGVEIQVQVVPDVSLVPCLAVMP